MCAARRSTLVALLLVLTGCPKDEPPTPLTPVAPDPPPESALEPFGVVTAVRPHADQATNLTRAESRLNLAVLADERDVAADSWIELTAAGAPHDAAPAATGRASEPVIVPPGSYRITLEWRAGPYAVGRGGVRNLELKPAEAAGLTLELDFPVGELLVHALSDGQRIDGDVDVRIEEVRLIAGEAGAQEVTDAGAGQGRAIGSLPAGEVVTLPVGTYRVRVVWRPPAGPPRDVAQVVDITRGRRATAELALGAAGRLTRLTLEDQAHRSDITKDSSIRVLRGERVVAEGPASRPLAVPRGRFDVEVRYRVPPLVDERHLLRSVSLGEDDVVLRVPVQVGRLRVHVARAGDSIDPHCTLSLTGQGADERSGEVPAGADAVVPPGRWHVTARCQVPGHDVATGQLRDVVIPPGANVVHRLRL